MRSGVERGGSTRCSVLVCLVVGIVVLLVVLQLSSEGGRRAGPLAGLGAPVEKGGVLVLGSGRGQRHEVLDDG